MFSTTIYADFAKVWLEMLKAHEKDVREVRNAKT